MTKAERHKVYKKALKLFISESTPNDSIGICHIINRVYGSFKEINDFPEILMHKPAIVDKLEYWWGTYTQEGYDKRIEVLKEAIKLTK